MEIEKILEKILQAVTCRCSTSSGGGTDPCVCSLLGEINNTLIDIGTPGVNTVVEYNTPGDPVVIPANWKAYSIQFYGSEGTFGGVEVEDNHVESDSVMLPCPTSIACTVPNIAGSLGFTRIILKIRQ